MPLKSRQIQAALSTRSTPRVVNLKSALFKEQYKFAASPARFRIARTSRRAGKTIACPAMLCNAAQEKPGSVALYITRTRLRAKELIWRQLLRWNAEHSLLGVPNETTLTMDFPNGSTVALAGINTKEEIEKRRGDPFSLVIIDEAQSLPLYLEQLVDDVLAPGLMDFNGSLVMTGTPPPVPVGYFSDACKKPGWELHEWNAWKNPYIKAKSGKTVRELLNEELERRGVTEDDPSIQREWYGRCVLDTSSLVLHYNAALNHYESVAGLTDFVIGVDVGYIDADAIAVLGWKKDEPRLWLVEEFICDKLTITPLANKIRSLQAKYNPIATVIDEGGSKKLAETIRREHGVAMLPADKTEKWKYIDLMNDALRTGLFMAKSDSRFAHDCMLLECNVDRTTPEKRAIKDSFHSDIIDAVLYGRKMALHWLHEPPKPKAKAKTAEELKTLESERTRKWLEDEETRAEEAINELKAEREKTEEFGGSGDW